MQLVNFQESSLYHLRSNQSLRHYIMAAFFEFIVYAFQLVKNFKEQSMPDLSHQAVHQFWKSYQDPTIYRVISFMEGVEDWTADGDPTLEGALKRLGDTLEDIGNIDLQQESQFINLGASLKTGRCLRLLMCLDMAYPGAAAKVLMHAEETTQYDEDTAGIFLRRNIVFERLRLLSRVFAQDRLKLVIKALEEGDYE